MIDIETIEINQNTGVIVKGENLTLQQDNWDGKRTLSIYLSRKELLELAEKLK